MSKSLTNIIAYPLPLTIGSVSLVLNQQSCCNCLRQLLSQITALFVDERLALSVRLLSTSCQ